MFDKKLLLQHIKNQDINTKNLSEQTSRTPEEAAARETTPRPSFLGRENPEIGRGISKAEYRAAVDAKKLKTAKFWDKFYKERRGINRPGAEVRAKVEVPNVVTYRSRTEPGSPVGPPSNLAPVVGPPSNLGGQQSPNNASGPAGTPMTRIPGVASGFKARNLSRRMA